MHWKINPRTCTMQQPSAAFAWLQPSREQALHGTVWFKPLLGLAGGWWPWFFRWIFPWRSRAGPDLFAKDQKFSSTCWLWRISLSLRYTNTSTDKKPTIDLNLDSTHHIKTFEAASLATRLLGQTSASIISGASWGSSETRYGHGPNPTRSWAPFWDGNLSLKDYAHGCSSVCTIWVFDPFSYFLKEYPWVFHRFTSADPLASLSADPCLCEQRWSCTNWHHTPW